MGLAALRVKACNGCRSTAPTARADDFTDILNDVEAQFSYGQTAFTGASADFGASDVSSAISGAQDFFSGSETDFVDAATALSSGDFVAAVYDRSLGSLYAFDIAPGYLLIGAVDALGF